MHFRWNGNKLLLNCTIQPGSSEERVVGVVGQRLKIRLIAPPSDGKANTQLVKFLATQFDVKQKAITIVSGHGSRQKKLQIENPQVIPLLMKIGMKIEMETAPPQAQLLRK